MGGKSANPFGLYDVHGNVWEWTATEWDEKRYRSRSDEEVYQLDPTKSAELATEPRVRRVLRGGSCIFTARGCRSAFREHWDPWYEIWNRGFRVLLSSVPSQP